MKKSLHFRPTNARFWEYLRRGWVKITLRPGGRFRHASFSRDDEGWSRDTTWWEFDGTVVTRHCLFEGRDCDGGIRNGCSQVCALHDLQSVGSYVAPHVEDGVLRPKWSDPKHAPAWDEYAEAANY